MSKSPELKLISASSVFSLHFVRPGGIFLIILAGQDVQPYDGEPAHLGGGSPVDDGLDEDAEVGVVLLGAVPLDADAQAGRTRVAERDLEGQELPRPVRRQNQLVFLHLGLQEEEEEELQSTAKCRKSTDRGGC